MANLTTQYHGIVRNRGNRPIVEVWPSRDLMPGIVCAYVPCDVRNGCAYFDYAGHSWRFQIDDDKPRHEAVSTEESNNA